MPTVPLPYRFSKWIPCTHLECPYSYHGFSSDQLHLGITDDQFQTTNISDHHDESTLTAYSAPLLRRVLPDPPHPQSMYNVEQYGGLRRTTQVTVLKRVADHMQGSFVFSFDPEIRVHRIEYSVTIVMHCRDSSNRRFVIATRYWYDPRPERARRNLEKAEEQNHLLTSVDIEDSEILSVTIIAPYGVTKEDADRYMALLYLHPQSWAQKFPSEYKWRRLPNLSFISRDMDLIIQQDGEFSLVMFGWRAREVGNTNYFADLRRKFLDK